MLQQWTIITLPALVNKLIHINTNAKGRCRRKRKEECVLYEKCLAKDINKQVVFYFLQNLRHHFMSSFTTIYLVQVLHKSMPIHIHLAWELNIRFANYAININLRSQRCLTMMVHLLSFFTSAEHDIKCETA